MLFTKADLLDGLQYWLDTNLPLGHETSIEYFETQNSDIPTALDVHCNITIKLIDNNKSKYSGKRSHDIRGWNPKYDY